MRLPRAYLPSLSRALWLFECSTLFQALGSGVITPFVIIYLHNVRGFSLAFSGAVGAAFAGAVFAGTFIGGDLADRFGARTPLRVSLVVMAAGFAGFAFAHSLLLAFVTIIVAGAANGTYWPPQAAILAELSPPERRHIAYALQRSLANAAFGLGATVGGLIAVTSRPETFSAIFLIVSACALVSLSITFFIRLPARRKRSVRSKVRWSELLRQRAILAIVVFNVIYFLGGYAVLTMALPVVAKNQAGISDRLIGLIFLANTLTILVLQMPIIKALEGHSRMRVLAAMASLWAALWLIILAALGSLSVPVATLVFILAGVVFAIGECALPLQSSLVADLSPPGLRARSLGLLTSAQALGLMFGQLILGFLLAHAADFVWIGAAGILVLSAAFALRLDRRLPDALRLAPCSDVASEPVG